jgi:hypothetical protein
MILLFQQIPEPLQRQTLIRAGLGTMFFVLFIIMLLTTQNIYLLLPCGGVATVSAASAFLLFRRAILGDYVIISGECIEVGHSALSKRAKYLRLQSGEQTLQIAIGQRAGKIPAGAMIDLYVAQTAPVYENNGTQMLYSYLAIDIRK